MASRTLNFAMFLSPKIVINAYYKGLFPMADSINDPYIFWVNPVERGIIKISDFRFSHSLRKLLKKDIHVIKINHDFEKVIFYCSQNIYRKSSWINNQIIDNYIHLNQMGKVISVECYHENKLIGGLYGLILGKIFCGESMFSIENNASKLSLVYLAAYLKEGGFLYIDTQFFSQHLKQFGAKKMSRLDFLKILRENRDYKLEFPNSLNKNVLEYF